MVFSKEDKILIKHLQHLKGYAATRFRREFRTKNWTRAQILTILKRTAIQTYNSAFNKIVHWHKLGEVGNECTSYNFRLFAIFDPKIIRFGVILT